MMLFRFNKVKILRRSLPLSSSFYGVESILMNEMRCFCKFLCQMTEPGSVTESPELPAWVKFCENENLSAVDSDEDFVVPTIAHWVESQQFQNWSKAAPPKPSENIDDSDVDRISKVLKGSFASPDAVSEALKDFSVTVSDSLVEQLLKRFNNDCISAFGFFKWVKSQAGYVHSPSSYNMMVDTLGKRKEFTLMWEVVEEMHRVVGCVPSVTVAKVMRRLARARRWTDAIDTFRGVERYGISKDIRLMNLLMDSLVKENSVEHAHNVFLEFRKEIPPDVSTFNVLIHGWCKVRKIDVAWKTMEEMKEYGCCPDAVSYTSIIEAHCRDKYFREVESILEQMQQKGCHPTPVTYTIYMHALGKAKELNKALKVYEKMKEHGLELDVPFYSSLIYILSEGGRLNDARDVFEEMKKQGLSPDVTTYNVMISIACLHSKEERALKLLREMEDRSCKPDLKTYAPLLKMCCNKKRMKVLQFLLAHMLKNDVSIDLGTYALLVHGLCKNGKLEHACLLFEEIILKGMVPNPSTYKLLTTELEKKNMKKAKQLVETLMLQTRKQEAVVC